MTDTDLEWEWVEGEQESPRLAYVVTERARVEGGYLYRVIHRDYSGRVYGVGGVAFVPDAAKGGDGG